ncbi:hypothetical protein FOCG_13534 [Fusarium oxysporum f. sp. radicis-lycopersici 26381]|uniref:Uncharacterized protein n=2 Tax=Fusarium oxysporum TaxID=5507 RepID=W9HZH6_FUSOX|nr:hypothetical protein FOYG_09361 [Fusarium oxysporum NRRL 32931]EWZ40514.1 hypothetical protein FOZG_09181 [Fusarium oxysporum Fo47]EWZ87390.1 hypothetical protein FOWG_09270 [Fusarium oxysporum f. sp. lycopersici MN25]EXL44567.1 hypothetical protein FOCG_13534 [Fusarium oxysporum f. sp. radicis-lycopersici 26381]
MAVVPPSFRDLSGRKTDPTRRWRKGWYLFYSMKVGMAK